MVQAVLTQHFSPDQADFSRRYFDKIVTEYQSAGTLTSFRSRKGKERLRFTDLTSPNSLKEKHRVTVFKDEDALDDHLTRLARNLNITLWRIQDKREGVATTLYKWKRTEFDGGGIATCDSETALYAEMAYADGDFWAVHDVSKESSIEEGLFYVVPIRGWLSTKYNIFASAEELSEHVLQKKSSGLIQLFTWALLGTAAALRGGSFAGIKHASSTAVLPYSTASLIAGGAFAWEMLGYIPAAGAVPLSGAQQERRVLDEVIEFKVNAFPADTMWGGPDTEPFNATFLTILWTTKDDGDGLGIAHNIAPDAPALPAKATIFNSWNTAAQYQPSASRIAGTDNVIVAWAGEDPEGDLQVFIKSFGPDRETVLAERLIDNTLGNQFSEPRIACSSDTTIPKAAVVWKGVKGGSGRFEIDCAIVNPLNGTLHVPKFSLSSQMNTDHITPSIAAFRDPTAGWVVVWKKDMLGILLTRLDASGLPISGQTNLLAIADADATAPDVVVTNSGNIVVCYHSSSLSPFLQTYFAVLDATGKNFVHPMTSIHPGTSDAQSNAKVVCIRDDNLVFIFDVDSGGKRVYARPFDRFFRPLDVAALLSSGATSEFASVASFPDPRDKRYAATWGGDTDNVYAGVRTVEHLYLPPGFNQTTSYHEDQFQVIAGQEIYSSSDWVRAKYTLPTISGRLTTDPAEGNDLDFNTSTGTLVIEGAPDTVTMRLANLRFVPSTNYYGNFTISCQFEDGTRLITDEISMNGVPVTPSGGGTSDNTTGEVKPGDSKSFSSPQEKIPLKDDSSFLHFLRENATWFTLTGAFVGIFAASSRVLFLIFRRKKQSNEVRVIEHYYHSEGDAFIQTEGMPSPSSRHTSTDSLKNTTIVSADEEGAASERSVWKSQQDRASVTPSSGVGKTEKKRAPNRSVPLPGSPYPS